MCGTISKISAASLEQMQKLSAMLYAPSRIQMQMMLFAVGVALLLFGLDGLALAQDGPDYDDEKLVEAMEKLFTYIEGAFGALVMVGAGIGAIISSAFGQYRASLGLLVVAVGSFILKSLVKTFFNTPEL